MITSNLKVQGLKVVGGTTLIREQTTDEFCKQPKIAKREGGEKLYKHIQALINPSTHKTLRFIALEQDITMAELFLEIINFYLKQKEN